MRRVELLQIRQQGIERVGGRRSGRPWPDKGPNRHRQRRRYTVLVLTGKTERGKI